MTDNLVTRMVKAALDAMENESPPLKTRPNYARAALIAGLGEMQAKADTRLEWLSIANFITEAIKRLEAEKDTAP